jgi:hypothetical protein
METSCAREANNMGDNYVPRDYVIRKRFLIRARLEARRLERVRAGRAAAANVVASAQGDWCVITKYTDKDKASKAVSEGDAQGRGYVYTKQKAMIGWNRWRCIKRVHLNGRMISCTAYAKQIAEVDSAHFEILNSQPFGRMPRYDEHFPILNIVPVGQHNHDPEVGSDHIVRIAQDIPILVCVLGVDNIEQPAVDQV